MYGFGVLLGGSWVVVSRIISSITILITHIRGLITLLTRRVQVPNNHILSETLTNITTILKPTT